MSEPSAAGFPSPLLWRSSLRYLARHPWQFGLAVLGVALGVAVVVSIDLANASAGRAFTLSTEAVTGRAGWGVRSRLRKASVTWDSTSRKASMLLKYSSMTAGEAGAPPRSEGLGVETVAAGSLRTGGAGGGTG